MAVTFAVDPVTPELRPLPKRHWREAAKDVLGANVDVVSHDALVVVDRAARRPHPLLGAVHLAFAEHRPLRLTPDQVWLTIAQGLALHVDENAEALRGRFVRHEGRRVVRQQHPRPAPPANADEWAACIDGLVDQVSDDVGAGVLRLFRCDFSTTTSIERIASHVVALAAFRAFYDYRIECSCGIPTVTLEGTVDDWQRVRARVDVVSEHDCAWWTRALAPVLDQFVKSAAGDVDVDFWQSIYKPRTDYDVELATGWICSFFPYLQHDDGRTERSPVFAAWSPSSPWSFSGLLPAQTPTGFARAPLVLEPWMHEVVVFAGFGGTAQDDAGVVGPVVVWGVGADAGGAAAIERVLQAPMVSRVAPATTVPPWLHGFPRVFYERHNGFRVADVVVRPVDRLQSVERLGHGPHVFADVDDGRAFAVELDGRPRVYLLEPQHAQMDLEDIVVVAHDLGDFLDVLAARDAGDPWPRVGDAYEHAERGVSEVRRALRQPGPVVRVLDDDEGWRLACFLGLGRAPGTEAHERFWWDVLQLSYGFTFAYDELKAIPGRNRFQKILALTRLQAGRGRTRPP